jgi:putative SOS response-associated peptidase YedK
MCNEYDPVTDATRLQDHFHAQPDLPMPDFALRVTAFRKQQAPVVLRRDGRLVAMPMRWPFVPWFEVSPNITYSTANCRSEEVQRKRAFRDAWARGKRCIVPAEAVVEPYWESSPPAGRQRVPQWKCTMQRFWRRDGKPIGIAVNGGPEARLFGVEAAFPSKRR